MRRWGILGSGFALIAVGGIWAAIAYASTSIQYETSAGQIRSIDFNSDRLKKDVKQEIYKVPNGQKRITGSSIQAFMSAIGVKKWNSVTVGDVTVTNNDDYYKGDKPVFYLDESDDDNLLFLRPKSPDGPYLQDNANGGTNLAVEYEVPVDAKISDTSPKPGQKVTFEVAVPDGGTGDYEFNWDTGGAAGSGTGKKFTVTYPSSAGNVRVTVTATQGGRTVARGVFASRIKQSDVDEQNENSSSGTGSGGTGSSSYTPPYTPPSFPDTSTPAIPEAPSLPKDQTKIPEIPEDPTATEITGELMSFTDPETGEPLGGEPAPIDPETGEPAPADDPAAETPAEETIAQQLENESITGPRAAITLGVIISLLGLGAGRELERFHPRRLLRRPNLSGLRRLPLPWK